MTTTAARRTGDTTAPADRHRNEVLLIGELTREPQARILTDGAEVSTFLLMVRNVQAGRAGDTIDCVVRSAALRSKIASRTVGDTLQITGSLRHRFWRSTGGLMSRYEVDVEKIAVRRRAADAAIGRRSDG